LWCTIAQPTGQPAGAFVQSVLQRLANPEPTGFQGGGTQNCSGEPSLRLRAKARLTGRQAGAGFISPRGSLASASPGTRPPLPGGPQSHGSAPAWRPTSPAMYRAVYAGLPAAGASPCAPHAADSPRCGQPARRPRPAIRRPAPRDTRPQANASAAFSMSPVNAISHALE